MLTFKQVFPFIKADLDAGQTPALLGEPGIGKSSLINDLARHFKTKVFTLPINQLADRADLTGVRMVQSESGSWSQKAFPHFKIMEAVEYAQKHPEENPILFLDEFNRASSDITSAVLSLQTERSIGSIEFPDNLRIIVAGNDKGNVTSLDQASISRFAVYKVKPDLETFLSIQTLNPFIEAVLAKFPNDLMAGPMVSAVDTDDDDDEETDDLMDFEFLSEESFTQITRPRTITYLSEWLNNMGLDKSGSDEEKQLLGTLFSDTTNEGTPTLLAGINAHVGETTFAVNLFNEINEYFNNMLMSNTTGSKPLLDKIRPKQDIINDLSRANNTVEIEMILASLSETDKLNTLIWLTEIDSTKEINNNNAVETYVTLALHQINQFDSKAVQNMMLVLPNPSKVSKLTLDLMLNSDATSMVQWKPMIKSVMEIE